MKQFTFFIKTLILSILLVWNFNAFSQNAPFSISLEPVNITNLGGLQSYAFGQHNGKWLIVGGRLDGLHRRQPWATFDIAGHNNQLLVIDVENQQKWTAALGSLPSAVQEQLSATNPEFFQEGDYLYVVGGYGYSATLGDHTTFDKLTAIDVPATIDAIINNSPVDSFFRQISDAQFAVTGGRLEKIYDTFYLVGGQKFLGRYNPMGPTHGSGFTQVYTEQVRRFHINDDGTNLSVTHLPAWTDAQNLHRRDYNVTAQIMPNGEEGVTAFSGVFQTTVDLPFLNCVNIDSSGYAVNNNFSQYYNHYHCANVPLYSAADKEMHTVFFGGIAQFYDSLGTLVQDNDVPFVKTIARVTRDSSGVMTEHKLAVEMPALLGAGSEFIPNPTLPRYENGVFKIDEFSSDTTLLGYIYGGISSSAPNIFWVNNGTQSSATSQIFKVNYIKNMTSSTHSFNPESMSNLKVRIFPNPNNGLFTVHFDLEEASFVKFTIHDVNGKLMDEQLIENVPAGEKSYKKKVAGFGYGVFFVTVSTKKETITRKVVIAP